MRVPDLASSGRGTLPGKLWRGVLVSMLPVANGYQHISESATRAILFVLLKSAGPENKRNCNRKIAEEHQVKQQVKQVEASK